MVTVFEGALTRTWKYENDEYVHVINLFHDTVSGVRCALLNGEEIPGSYGNSPIVMEAQGHILKFNIGPHKGYLRIKRTGWIGFDYFCNIDGVNIVEVTHTLSSKQANIKLFYVNILSTVATMDKLEQPITWYLLEAKRLSDNLTTRVYRRFKDFADLNSQIKQNLKGHHLRSSLPLLPGKHSKLIANHSDGSFVAERLSLLKIFLTSLLEVPHVEDMPVLKTFLGITEHVKELSYCYQNPTLGLSLLPSNRTDIPTAIVGTVSKPEFSPGLQSGDVLTRVNGKPVTQKPFPAIIHSLKKSKRPLILHFMQLLALPSDNQTNAADPALSNRSNSNQSSPPTSDPNNNNHTTTNYSSSSSSSSSNGTTKLPVSTEGLGYQSLRSVRPTHTSITTTSTSHTRSEMNKSNTLRSTGSAWGTRRSPGDNSREDVLEDEDLEDSDGELGDEDSNTNSVL